MKRHVYVAGAKIPIERKSIRYDGLAYKRTKSDLRPCKRRIVIHKRLRADKAIATIVHEMLHQLNIGLSEKTILQLEDGIVRMVEENPEVFSDLSGLLEKK